MKVTQPLNGYLLIKPRASEAVAGIEIPDSVDKEKATVGVVVISNFVKMSPISESSAQNLKIKETGEMPPCYHHPAAGSLVLFNAFAPRKVEHEGEECLLVNGEDIYAIIEA